VSECLGKVRQGMGRKEAEKVNCEELEMLGEWINADM